jgi:hypothetical protein
MEYDLLTVFAKFPGLGQTWLEFGGRGINPK